MSNLRNLLLTALVLFFMVPVSAQTIKELTFNNTKFGVSFVYKSTIKVTDKSEGNQFKVVASLEGYDFTFTAIPETPGHTVLEFANYIHDYMNKADASKTNYRITEMTPSEVSSKKVYYIGEFFDKGADKIANHIMILDLPFTSSMGIMLKAETLYETELEKLVLQEMLYMLSSFKKV